MRGLFGDQVGTLSETSGSAVRYADELHSALLQAKVGYRNGAVTAAALQEVIAQARAQLAIEQDALQRLLAAPPAGTDMNQLADQRIAQRTVVERLDLDIRSAQAALTGQTITTTPSWTLPGLTTLPPYVSSIGASVVGGTVTGLIAAWALKGSKAWAVSCAIAGDLIGRGALTPMTNPSMASTGMTPGVLSSIGAVLGALMSRKPKR